jgi:hypothetical protein
MPGVRRKWRVNAINLDTHLPADIVDIRTFV